MCGKRSKISSDSSRLCSLEDKVENGVINPPGDAGINRRSTFKTGMRTAKNEYQIIEDK